MNHYLSIFLFSCLLVVACGDSPKETSKSKKDKPQEKVAATTTPDKTTKKKKIIFFGNSLTAGYGLDPAQSFASLIQNKIDSLDLAYEVVNAGLSGETTAGGNSRVDWILRQPIDVFILELGGNDGLRGIDPQSSMENLQSIIDKVQKKYPAAKIVLAGMEAPPNMGDAFTSAFREMYPKLATANKTALIPFLLENVGGIPELNQADGIHPTAKGHQIISETIWKVLKDIL